MLTVKLSCSETQQSQNIQQQLLQLSSCITSVSCVIYRHTATALFITVAILSALSTITVPTAAQTPNTDKHVLQLLYTSTDGRYWDDKTNWNSDNPLRIWYGIDADARDNVTQLLLQSNDLSGNIPTEIGELANLRNLNLSDNDIRGSIPTQIGDLANVTRLDLSRNKLSGSIPSKIGDLTELTTLNLYNNRLSGPIPTQIGNLAELANINFYYNRLSGPIPTQIGNLAELTRLNLSYNNLSDSIPTQIGDLTKLTTLNLSNNNLSDSIPTQIGDLTKLTTLNLSNNDLSGSIPAEIGDLTKLTTLNLKGNKFWGSIPRQIGNLTKLTTLNLKGNPYSYNRLSGSIPAEIGNLTKLTTLYLSSNRLSGSIPAEIGDLTKLTTLDLGSNNLSGSIPAEIGDLTKLNHLDLDWNDLSDSIPAEIGDLTNLHSIDLDWNDLSGSIPAEIGDLTNLARLSITWNKLSGSIPAEIGDLTKLTRLNLSSNNLSGSIPERIGDLSSLSTLSLRWNKLSGWIPEQIGDLTKLTHLDLRYNSLSGPIPSQIGDLTKLTRLYLTGNSGLVGPVPSELRDLNLSTIDMTGTNMCLPASMKTWQWYDTLSKQGLKACPTTPPGKPEAPTLTSGDQRLDVSWTSPTDNGNAIYDYEIQYRSTGSTDWTSHTHDGTTTTNTITGLTNGTTYEVQVSARNTAGSGPWSDTASGAPAGSADIDDPNVPTNPNTPPADPNALPVISVITSPAVIPEPARGLAVSTPTRLISSRFFIMLDQPTTDTVTVTWTIDTNTPETAVYGTDYTLNPDPGSQPTAKATITAGEQSTSIIVIALEDNQDDENSEKVILTLTNPQNATLHSTDYTATTTITNTIPDPNCTHPCIPPLTERFKRIPGLQLTSIGSYGVR